MLSIITQIREEECWLLPKDYCLASSGGLIQSSINFSFHSIIRTVNIDNNLVITCYEDTTIVIWNLLNGATISISKLRPDGDTAKGFAVTDDYKLIILWFEKKSQHPTRRDTKAYIQVNEIREMDYSFEKSVAEYCFDEKYCIHWTDLFEARKIENSYLGIIGTSGQVMRDLSNLTVILCWDLLSGNDMLLMKASPNCRLAMVSNTIVVAVSSKNFQLWNCKEGKEIESRLFEEPTGLHCIAVVGKTLIGMCQKEKSRHIIKFDTGERQDVEVTFLLYVFDFIVGRVHKNVEFEDWKVYIIFYSTFLL